MLFRIVPTLLLYTFLLKIARINCYKNRITLHFISYKIKNLRIENVLQFLDFNSQKIYNLAKVNILAFTNKNLKSITQRRNLNEQQTLLYRT